MATRELKEVGGVNRLCQCLKTRGRKGLSARKRPRGAGSLPRVPSPASVSLTLPQVAAINPSHPLAQMPLPPSMKNCIQLAACEATELLPMIPDLPADLFTSCLTTPIKIALRW